MTGPPLSGWLGPGARFVGDLTFSGPVRIDGLLRGVVRTDDLVEVGERGVIEGEVDAPQVLVSGRVDGTLRGRERITLLETAIVVGRLLTPWLDVRNGARVRGDVQAWREDG
jgi:cytoskeletal protein CcmA (bactofilin family)